MSARWVGTPVRRQEDARLLTARGRYVADLRVPGMASAAILRSPHPHARILRVDASRARALPGVHGVFTGADFPGVGRIPMRLSARPGVAECLQRPIAIDRVRYVGEPIAVVVADSRYRAEDALELLDADFEPLPAVGDVWKALEPGAPVLHEALGGNTAQTLVMACGDAGAALKAAAVRLRVRFRVQRHTGVPLETRGLLAQYDAGSRVLTVWGPTKVPHFNRRVLAELLGHPEHLIHFIEPEVGGGFGIRGEFYPEDYLTPAVALRLGRPVQWIEDRREHFLAANHSREQWHDVEIGSDRKGQILALVDRVHADMGAYVRTHGFVVQDRMAAMLPGPYRIPNYRCEVACVLTNKTPGGTYRGPGRYEGTVVRERAVDALAAALGRDPTEVRRRNFIQPHEMPYDLGVTADAEPVVYDSGDFPGSLEAALRAADYASLRRRQAAMRRQGRHVGIGIGCAVEKSGTGPWEYARVEIDGSGRAVVYTGLAALGQGLETTLAQVCADELGLVPGDITVVHGDTNRVPYGVGTFGSRGMAVGGSAVLEAARAVKDKAKAVAAALLEASVEDLALDAGAVFPRGARDRGLTLKDLARAASSAQVLVPGLTPGLEASAFFKAPRRPYPYATHLAVVDIDPETGGLRVLRYVIAYDVGTIVNPTIVEGQVVGGLAQGLGGALLEELVYDADAQLLTTTFMDYLLPSAAEMPDELVVLPSGEIPSPLNPLGIKGAGEVGCTGAGAALANAVADALAPLGVSVTDLPLSPVRIVQMINEARQGLPPRLPDEPAGTGRR